MASTNPHPRDDYGLNEQDISRHDVHPDDDFFQDDDVPLRNDDRRAQRHVDDFEREREREESPMAHPENQPQKPASFWAKYRLYLIVGGFGLVIFGGMAWAVMQLTGPKPAHRNPAPADFSSQAMMQRSNPVSAPATDPVLIDQEVMPEPERGLPVIQQTQQAPADQAMPHVAPITQRTMQEQDDTFYDELVRSSDRGSPVEQRPADQAGSVSSRTDDKLEALSKAITDSGREMGIVLNAVKVLSEDVKSLRQQVEASSSKSAALEGQLNKVSSGLDDLSKKTESRLKEISKSAVTAAIAAVNRDRKPAQEKLVLVGERESLTIDLPLNLQHRYRSLRLLQAFRKHRNGQWPLPCRRKTRATRASSARPVLFPRTGKLKGLRTVAPMCVGATVRRQCSESVLRFRVLDAW